MLGFMGAAVLFVLPGMWIACGLRLDRTPFWQRLALGMVMSPVVVYAQFLLLRWVGVSFAATSVVLAVVNLPSLVLVVSRLRSVRFGGWRLAIASLGVVSVPLALLAIRLADAQLVAYAGHNWMHGDIAYGIASGGLRPEEASLAGIKLSYPWAGHVHQAVVSYLLDVPPVVAYRWANAIWLLCIFGFASGVVASLGGNKVSKLTVSLWLALGANYVGYILNRTLPPTIVRTYPVWGDERFTPFLRKFFGFNQMPLALALFAGVVYFGTRLSVTAATRATVVSLFVLLAGLGVVYPILFPAGAAVLAGTLIAVWAFPAAEGSAVDARKQTLVLLGVLGAAALVTFAHVAVITTDRASGQLFTISTMWLLKVKTVEMVIVLVLPLLGLAVVLPRIWRDRRRVVSVLVLTSVACVCAYVLLHLWCCDNEYKFVYPVMICLAPFPAIALEPILDRLGRFQAIAVAVLAAVLVAPALHKVISAEPRDPPLLADLSAFEMRLQPGSAWAAVVDSIRENTPESTIVVAEDPPVHLPTVTGRAAYVPVVDTMLRGVGFPADRMLVEAKGYDLRIIEERRTTVLTMLHGTDEIQRRSALEKMFDLDRPLAFILQVPDDAGTRSWLDSRPRSETVYDDGRFVVLLLTEATVSSSGDLSAAGASRSGQLGSPGL
jgi:hypothetical protein